MLMGFADSIRIEDPIAQKAEFVVMKGKVYYLSPAYPMLLAAGSVAIEEWTAARARAWRVATAAIVAVTGAALAPLTLPILPVETYIAYQRALHFEPPRTENHRFGPLPQQYADMFGWPEMVAMASPGFSGPSYGFSPFLLMNTDTLQVDRANERFAVPAFADGVELYKKVVRRLVSDT